MATISLQDLEKSYGGRTLFDSVTLQLSPGRRYGLVGANGSGKSTLMRILAGDDTPTDGTVGIAKGTRIGVMRQDRFLADDETVLALAMQGDEEVYRAITEHDRLSHSGLHDDDTLHAVAELEERIRVLDGYTLEARASSVLEGLGIEMAKHRRPLRELSGGYKLRVLLAQVLLGRPEILLLDEPTNHLDILSIRWLEKFLTGYEGLAVVISHDQRFLDNVVTHVLDVDYETVWLYTGSYSSFEEQKAAITEQKEAANARAEELIAQKKAFVERFRAKATKARQAQSRLKQLEKIEVEELKPTSRRAPRLKFQPLRPSGRDVLTAKGVAKAYGEKHVLSGVELVVRRGERVGIIGANGLGKSTLLRILAGKLERDAGEVAWGHESRVGYFPQDHHELMPDPSRKILDYLWDVCPLEGTSYVRGQLGLVLFSGDDVDKKLGSLSGGEAARVLFARLAVEKPNVLLLDEPTNHLDVEAIRALAESLRSYDGTVLFVSHNRWFVSELATRIVEVKPNGIVDFPGGYDDYLARCGDDHLDADAVVAKKRAADASARQAPAKGGGPKSEAPPPSAPKPERAVVASGSTAARAAASNLPYEEIKRRRNRIKTLEKQLEKTTGDLGAAESRLKAIRDGWGEDGFYERTSAADIEKLQGEEKQLEERAMGLMMDWEQTETELGELKASLGEG